MINPKINYQPAFSAALLSTSNIPIPNFVEGRLQKELNLYPDTVDIHIKVPEHKEKGNGTFSVEISDSKTGERVLSKIRNPRLVNKEGILSAISEIIEHARTILKESLAKFQKNPGEIRCVVNKDDIRSYNVKTGSLPYIVCNFYQPSDRTAFVKTINSNHSLLNQIKDLNPDTMLELTDSNVSGNRVMVVKIKFKSHPYYSEVKCETNNLVDLMKQAIEKVQEATEQFKKEEILKRPKSKLRKP